MVHPASILDKKWAKILLVIFGLVATVSLLPTAILVSVIGVTSIVSGGHPPYYEYAYIGIGGAAGIVAAWLRIGFSTNQLKEHTIIQIAIFSGLLFGVSVAVYLGSKLIEDPLFPVFWAYSLITLLGLFLASTTICLPKG